MFNFFKKTKPKQEVSQPIKRVSLFSTDIQIGKDGKGLINISDLMRDLFKKQPAMPDGYAQDDSSTGYPSFKQYLAQTTNISEVLVGWYASQAFIGHQLCGILAQNWLINKACTMPADDAIRKGYNIVSADGEELDPEALKLIKRYDKAMRLNKHLKDFVRKGRIFGVRLAMFKVESTDPDYYENPFNIDGVTPGSYKGIVQIDPYWVAPLLDQASSSVPDSLHFYEPTYWMINGRKVHRSHLIIFRHCDPIDLLKPQYIYGGIPLPQQIMERVYAAERTANEAPQLAMTKRTNVWLTDMEAAMSDTTQTFARLQEWAAWRDNYGVKLGDKDGDEFQQYDTSLADMDALIMTQYQLVAAQANVPATKLLGTSPKGFGAAGDYEIASYHEMLESLQENDLTPLLERHHSMVIQSFVKPLMPDIDVDTTVAWNPLDTPTAKELADTNFVKLQGDQLAVTTGAIDSETVRMRLATDKTSGYNELGLQEEPAPGIPEQIEGDNDSEEKDHE
jgi:uncharacterized protein